MKTLRTVSLTLLLECIVVAFLGAACGYSTTHAQPFIVSDLPSAISVSLGGEVTLSVEASSPGPLSYQWFKDGAPLPGVVGTSFQIASAVPADNGKYRVVVSDNIGGSTPSTDCTLSVADTYLWSVTVIREGAATGTVVSSLPGINCGLDCEEYFAATGPSVTLMATPVPGSIFAGWNENGIPLGNARTLALPMTSGHNITATFSPAPPVPHVLTMNKAGTGDGTVSSSQPPSPSLFCPPACPSVAVTYDHNTTVIITATADATSTFVGWDVAGANPPTRVLRMDSDKTLTAIFTRNTFSLSVFKAGTGDGLIVSSPAGINCGADCQENYPAGSGVALTAVETPDSIFTGWSGAGTTDVANPLLRHVTLDAAHSVTAAFARKVGRVIAKEGVDGGDGDVYFDFLEQPQIDDSGRVLFHGSLVARPGSDFLPVERKQGLWYSRNFIRARRANAIFGTYATMLLRGAGMNCMGNSLMIGTEQTLLTPEGEIVVYYPDLAGLSDSRLAIYSPHIASSEITCNLVEDGRPTPLFERVALPDFLPDASPGLTNYWGPTFSSPAFLGSRPFAVPAIGDSRYVAFLASYGRYTHPRQPATNLALVSVNPLGDLGILNRLPNTFITPTLLNLGGLIGNGHDALAGYGFFEVGENAVPGIWTRDDGWLARFGTPVSALPPEYINPTFRSFSQLNLARDGAVAFTASFNLNEASVVGSNAAIFLSVAGHSLDPIAVSGQLVMDGVSARKMDFTVQSPVSLSDGAGNAVAFGAKADSRDAIVLHESTGNRVVVTAGMPAPRHAPAKFLFPPNVIGSAPNRPFVPVITSERQIIFFANVGDGTNWFNVTPGVWSWESTGAVRPLLQVGDYVPSLGIVGAITEPVARTRYVNNAGQVTLVVATFPDGVFKTAIVKVSSGPSLGPTITVAPALNLSGSLVLRLPSIYGDAAIERIRDLGMGAPTWERIAPAFTRMGDEYITEIDPSGEKEFFRLVLPDNEAP